MPCMRDTTCFFFPDTPDLPLPERHRFPGGKYRQLREKVILEDTLGRARLAPSPAATIEQLQRAHCENYVRAVLTGTLPREAQRRIGIPWSTTLARRSRATVGGSLAAARMALEHGISGQLAGGTHHAHRDFGSGFCTFNDLAVAALTLLDEGVVRRIAILDVDVHQGDGNAAILTPETQTLVVSIHGAKNFPFRKVASDIDIALPDGTGDDDYLAALAQAWTAIERFKPDLVCYLAGADPLDVDSLGRLSLSMAGLARRDAFVLENCRTLDLPVAIVAGGGYAKPISATVEAYAQTLALARDVFGL